MTLQLTSESQWRPVADLERQFHQIRELITLARQAVFTIKTKSGLKDLWEEGVGTVARKWHSAIADLEQRLQDSDT